MSKVFGLIKFPEKRDLGDRHDQRVVSNCYAPGVLAYSAKRKYSIRKTYPKRTTVYDKGVSVYIFYCCLLCEQRTLPTVQLLIF